MEKIRKKYNEEFKKNAVRLSFESTKSIKKIAEDLGIKANLLYTWRRKYTVNKDKTQYTTLEEKNKKLRKELAKAKMERDMLKKAADYDASHQE